MNRILSFGLAAAATTLIASPVYADKDGKGKGGGGGGGGGGKVSAPAHFSAPKGGGNVMRSQSRSYAPMAHMNTYKSFSPSVSRGQSFQFDRPQGKSPSVAFGGHVIDNNNNKNAFVIGKSGRNFGTTQSRQFSTRGNVRAFQPPTQMSRDWDRGRTHEWNHHHFRWDNGNWVIIDYGYPYDYSYGYGDYDYDQPAPYSYSSTYSSDSLAASVQEQLARQGYDPGPIDGVIGGQTRNAIADFQNDHGLAVTGAIDRSLLRALGL